MKRFLYLTCLLAATSTVTLAQENENEQPLDTLARYASQIRQEVDVLKRIKIGGYVQSQFQWVETRGAKSVAGGDFPSQVDKRFKVRRAEFKTMYDNHVTQIVANIDVTQNGINIKDAYGKITEQKLKAFSLTAGIFNRPFGFEVPYSSGNLETPERARMIQALFPGERDLGAMITWRPNESSSLHPLKIEGGMFNGTGNINNDFDSQKDFIGNIHWSQTSASEKQEFAFGVSYYHGGWSNGTKYLYTSDGDAGFKLDSSDANLNAINKREYMGADAQYTVHTGLGITTLRAEVISGTQPGTKGSASSPVLPQLTDTYQRKFNGAYFYFVQGLGHTRHQVVVKYDWYDPNTDVTGDQIGLKTGTGATDIKYTTLGLGWIYHWNLNVKAMLYYDMVTNETSRNLAGFTNDLEDNVLTLRVQFKF